MLKNWGTTCDINQETRSLSMEQNVPEARGVTVSESGHATLCVSCLIGSGGCLTFECVLAGYGCSVFFSSFYSSRSASYTGVPGFMPASVNNSRISVGRQRIFVM